MKEKLKVVGGHGLKICEDYWPTSRGDYMKLYCKTCGEELWECKTGKLFCPNRDCPEGR